MIIPWQFGPKTRTPYFFALSRNAFCKAIPSSPISLKPAELMITDLIPLFPQSSMICGTNLLGIITCARSISPGTSKIFVYALIPLISGSLGLIGYIFPVYP